MVIDAVVLECDEMADVKWIKITTDIFDDEKILLIESMPDADAIIVIWFKLLCFAGKQNNSGVFLMNGSIPYTDEMFATVFRRKVTTVKMALEVFERFGMITRLDDVVTIPKWGKHQSLDQLEAKREYMREYMAEYRQKQKQITCKTNCKDNVSHLDKEEEKEIEKNRNIYTSHFEQFWSIYPRKSEKAKAYKAYNARLKDGFSEDELLIAAKAYSAECKKDRREQKYIKLGATFLSASTPFTDYLSNYSEKGGAVVGTQSASSFKL